MKKNTPESKYTNILLFVKYKKDFIQKTHLELLLKLFLIENAQACLCMKLYLYAQLLIT